MKPDRASRTAEHNALFRALERTATEPPPLFDDALAGRFLTWPLSAVNRAASIPRGGRALRNAIDHRWPGVRTSVVARTRLIDDILGALPAEQLGQLVILGAGFDSRPYRLESLRTIPVFEVDYPSTQQAKQRALTRTLGALPPNVSFIASDFNLRQLGSAMEATGYDRAVPTVFLWEGVTNYLTEQAVDATLRWCARSAAGNTLVFTYIDSDVLTNPERYVGADRLQATLAKVDERLTFGLDPDDMGDYLARRGLDRQWDIGAAEYRQRYFGELARAMVGHEFYRVALARVHEH
jgi:methyltransferase (TIGR00027 family)